MSSFQSALASHMSEYIAYKSALGYCGSTYKSSLLNLDRFLLKAATKTIALEKEAVLEWMQKRPTEDKSHMSDRASFIRCFARYLSAMGIPAYILPQRFSCARRSGQPYIFTDGELQSLFEVIDEDRTKESLESMAFSTMMRLTYTCGLRPGESRTLRVCDVDLAKGEVHIRDGKKHIERIVIMSDDMSKSASAYDAARRLAIPECEAFFANAKGEYFTREWVRRRFWRCWRDSHPGISAEELPRVRIYDLRHRFACVTLNRWLDEKRDLYVMLPYLSAYMGHSCLSSTAYYIHLLPENLAKSPGVDWEALNALIPEVDVWPE